VANAFDLLKLDPRFNMDRRRSLSAGHGLALLAVADPSFACVMAQRVGPRRLDLRQRRLAFAPCAWPSFIHRIQVDANIKAALEDLQRTLGTKIVLQSETKIRRGSAYLEYYDKPISWSSMTVDEVTAKY